MTIAPMSARKVVTEQEIANGVCLFAPCSMSTVKTAQGKASADAAVTMKVKVFKEVHEVVVLPKIATDPKGAQAICPFWFVRATEHPQVANVCMVAHTVKVGAVDVHCMVMQTKKTIKEGQELFIHRGA